MFLTPKKVASQEILTISKEQKVFSFLDPDYGLAFYLDREMSTIKDPNQMNEAQALIFVDGTKIENFKSEFSSSFKLDQIAASQDVEKIGRAIAAYKITRK